MTASDEPLLPSRPAVTLDQLYDAFLGKCTASTKQGRVIWTFKGFVAAIRGAEAEIGLHEEGGIVHYTIPAERLAEKGIAGCDDFFFDVIEIKGGLVGGRLRAIPAEPCAEPAEGYLDSSDSEVWKLIETDGEAK